MGTGKRPGPEQVRIVYLVAQGLTDDQIARMTKLGRSTVQRLISAANEALEVSGRVALVVRAIQLAIVDPSHIEVRRRPHRRSAAIVRDFSEGCREPL